jgi:GNAT superfamily N-acetyltransferase
MAVLSIESPDLRSDLEPLAELLDAYRVFYGLPSDLEAARAFVRERLERSDTRFFIVRAPEGALAAFAHLLPSLDTLSLRPIGILEDMYVAEAHRKAGIGGALLDAAAAYAREHGYSRLTLATAHQNRVAQRLYLAHGYVPDQRFRTFNYFLDDSRSAP